MSESDKLKIIGPGLVPEKPKPIDPLEVAKLHIEIDLLKSENQQLRKEIAELREMIKDMGYKDE